jgi:hypothetical protein
MIFGITRELLRDGMPPRTTPSFPLAVVGSAGYIQRHGRPGRVDDLRRHDCLRFRRSNGAIAESARYGRWPFGMAAT